MKAIVRDRYGSPDVLRLVEATKPVPEDDQVLVRVRAASVNTADLDHLRGFPPFGRLETGVPQPASTRGQPPHSAPKIPPARWHRWSSPCGHS